MTVTADTLSNYIDDSVTRFSGFEFFSLNLFRKTRKANNRRCVMIDISKRGGAVLVPLAQSVSSELINLYVMDPDNKKEILTVIKAEKRWIDEKYSTTHKKMGLEFDIPLPAVVNEINSLISLMSAQPKLGLECGFTSR